MKRFRSRRAAGGLKVQEITGDHFSFMQVSRTKTIRDEYDKLTPFCTVERLSWISSQTHGN